MFNFRPEFLLLLPMGLSVAFLLWALWHLWLDERRKP
jgi:hypothetical protein